MNTSSAVGHAQKNSRRSEPSLLACYHTEQKWNDVRDLLERDFALIDFLGQTVVRLATPTPDWSAEDRLGYAERSITKILDLEIDKVLMLAEHMTTLIAMQNPNLEEVTPACYPQCERLNRLGRLAQSLDYTGLVPGGRDAYSAMSSAQLSTVLGAERWVELQLNLRSQNLLTADNEVRAARWVARGLLAFHAVEKIKYECRTRTNRSVDRVDSHCTSTKK